MDFKILIVLLLVSACFTTGLIFYVWRHRTALCAGPYMGLLAAASIYSAGYALELASPNLEDMLLWSKVQYFGISFIPAFYILVALRYIGWDSRLSTSMTVTVFFFSFLTLAFRLTNQHHGLIYQSSWVEYSYGHRILAFEEGLWYYVHMVYINFSCALGAFVYVRFYLKAAPFYRRQIMAMVVASTIPWSAYIVYILWRDMPKIDLIPFAITLSAPVWAIGIFRYQLMNLAPIARDSIFENMADGVMVLDWEDRLTDYNPAAQRILPELNDHLIGYRPTSVFQNYPEVAGLLKNRQEAHLDIKTTNNGETAFYRTSLIQLNSKKGRALGYMLSFSNITEQVKLMQKLEIMASTDELTGIYNRRYLLSLSKVEISRAKRHGLPLSLIIMDLDHFKNVNDQYGHALGDQVLKEVAQVISNNIRDIDVFGRYGGEEFAVLLPDTLPAKARQVAERLCSALHHHLVPYEEGFIKVTASFGVAGSLTMHQDSLRGLLNNADQALYKAKAGGRNQVVLYTGSR